VGSNQQPVKAVTAAAGELASAAYLLTRCFAEPMKMAKEIAVAETTQQRTLKRTQKTHKDS